MALRCTVKLQPLFKRGGYSKITPNLILRTFTSIYKPEKCSNAIYEDKSIQRRFFFSFFRKPSAEQLRIKDNIPEDFHLIYRNALQRYLRFAQVFTSASFVGGLILCCVGTKSENADLKQVEMSTFVATDLMNSEITVYVASFALFWTMLYLLVERMPIRIYSLAQKRKYIFVFYGNMPFSSRRIRCHGDEIVKLEESGVLPWKDQRYDINKKQRVIMLENFFRRPADLNIMLGYQEAPKDYD